MRNFLLSALSLAFIYSVQAEETLTVDFGRKSDGWDIERGAVRSTPSGEIYCHLSTDTAQKTSRINSPRIALGGAQNLEVSFSYRTPVTVSSLHVGVWLFIGFLDPHSESLGYRGEPLSMAETWTDKTIDFAVPEKASQAVVQFRIQQKKGEADFRDIELKLSGESFVKAKRVSIANDALKEIASYKLLESNGVYALECGEGILRPEVQTSTFPVSFVLPDRYCDNETLVYQLDISFLTNWDSRKQKKTQALFTLGRNMTGTPMPNSTTVIIWKGNTLYTRVTPAFVQDKKQIIKQKCVFNPVRENHVSVRFDSTSLNEIFNGEEQEPEHLQTPFVWPKGRSFFIGAEAKGASVFAGEITSFKLTVYKKALDVEMDKSIKTSYFYGRGKHSTLVHFPDGNARECNIDFTITDLYGNTVADKLECRAVTPEVVEVEIPEQPFGWYSIHCTISHDGDEAVLSKSFVIMPAKPTRVIAEESAYGITQGVRIDAYKELDRLFAISAEAGARWWRYWLNWSDIEPEPGDFRWEAMDRVVETAEKYGIELYPVMGGGRENFQRAYKPDYRLMSSNQIAPPLDVWKRYLRNFAQRYKGRIKYYQIWNEPDTRCGLYPFTPEAYLEVLKAGAEALRRVNKENVIGLGGFCVAFEGHFLESKSHKPDDNAWGAAEFYDLEPQQYFDVTDLHLYSLDNPTQSWDRNVHVVRRMMKFLKRYGEDKKPVWNSETCFLSSKKPGSVGGWTGTKRISERDQAARLIQWYTQSFAVGIEKNFWYMLVGEGGIAYPDFTPKPSFAAHSTVVREFRNMRYAGEEKGIKNFRAYFFKGIDVRKTVAWTLHGTKTIVVSGKAPVKVKDMWGNEVSVQQLSDCNIINVGVHPVFIESSDETELKTLVSFELPTDLIKGQPFELSYSLSNPADRETEYRIFIEQEDEILKKFFKLPPRQQKEGSIVLDRNPEKLLVETKTSGGFAFDFFHEFDCNFRNSIILADGELRAGVIDKSKHVHIGNEVLDLQGRVSMESLWKGPEDLSSRFTVQRKKEYIHFQIEVIDDVVETATGKTLYMGDCIELFLDFSGESDRGLENVCQVLIAADGRIRGMRDTLPDDFFVEVKKNEKGYLAKGRFRLPRLEKNQFGFDIAIDDSDKKNVRKVQMVWTGTDENYKAPEKYGLIMLK